MSYNSSMNLYQKMENMEYTGYSLSKKSGVSYTTIKDVINGKRKIENLPGKTILLLAKALNCTMEDVMNMEINNNVSSTSFLTKSEYYTKLLKNKKNVILAKESALEYYHLSNDSFSDKAYVYSCGKLDGPYINEEVENFNDIEYEVINGTMVTSLSQTINDIVEDEDIDLQPLYEALNKYYHQHNKSFDGIKIKEENKDRFAGIVKDSMDYYKED